MQLRTSAALILCCFTLTLASWVNQLSARVYANLVAIKVVLADLEQQAVQPDYTVELSDQLLTPFSKDENIRRLLGYLYLQRHQLQQAVEILGSNETDHQDVITRYLFGKALFAYGVQEEAVAVWRTVTNLDQHFAFLGDIAFDQKDKRAALHFYGISWQIANTTPPSKTTMFLNLCREHRNLREMETAIYWCKQATASRDNYWTRIELGRTLYEAADYKFAEKVLRETISSFPEMGDAYYYLGMTLRKSGREKEGIEKLSTSVDLMPTSPWPRIAIADALAAHNCNRQAVIAYTQALNLTQRDDLRSTLRARIQELEKRESQDSSQNASCLISLDNK